MAAYALLVGISQFTDPRLAKLNAPRGDVEALADVLRDPARGGFDNVATCIDQEVQDIRDQLVGLLDDRNPDDMVLLYYSGHGIVTKGQRLFLATGQTSFERPQARSLSALEMRDMLEQSRAGKQVVILDCCHSGAFVDDTKGVAQTITDDTFGSESAEGQYVLTATDALQFAYDASGTLREGSAPVTLSRFTGWLVDAIGKGEAAPESDQITLDAVYDYLSRRARVEAAGMTPKRFVKRGSGELVIARNPAAQPPHLPDELIARLDSKDWQARRDAVAEVGRLAEQPRFQALSEKAVADRLSGERDVDVREAMLTLLRRIGTAPISPEPAASPEPKPSPMPSEMRPGTPLEEAETKTLWRRAKWGALAAGTLAAATAGGYVVISSRSDTSPPASKTASAGPALDASPAVAALRARVNDLTPAEALKVVKTMEPNLTSRRTTVRDFIKGVDPTNLRFSEGPVAKSVLDIWVVNDDRTAASIKQWMDALGAIDVSRRQEAADRATQQAEGARQREAETVRQREAEAARQQGAEAARQRDAEAAKQRAAQEAAQKATIIEIQRALKQTGFYTGGVDGNLGLGTQAAIAAYQRSAGLAVTGKADEPLLAKLKQLIAATVASRAPDAGRNRTGETASPREDELRLNPGTEFKDCAECPSMITVPAGSVIVGSPGSEAGREPDEGPQHRVTIARNFAVGKYEVTFAEWDSCVANGGCNGYRPPDEGWGRGKHPVINVSWNDAQAYVEWLSRKTGKSYRLLTESEWEYAARAGTMGAFYWGLTASAGWARNNARTGTAAVGTYRPNTFGLYDMSGNVSEWALDCSNKSYAGAPADGSARTTGDCNLHVLRGGAWNSDSNSLRSANRDWDTAGIRVSRYGFRVARGL